MTYYPFRSSTLFNLAPPGWGKTSFRIGEVIQLGRIPIYVYDSVPWLPYAGSVFDIEQVGILCKEMEVDQMVEKILRLAQNEEVRSPFLLYYIPTSFFAGNRPSWTISIVSATPVGCTGTAA